MPVFPSAREAVLDEKCLEREASRGTLPAVPEAAREVEDDELDVVEARVRVASGIRLFVIEVIDLLPAEEKQSEEDDGVVVCRDCASRDQFLEDRIGRLAREERTSMDKSSLW